MHLQRLLKEKHMEEMFKYVRTFQVNIEVCLIFPQTIQVWGSFRFGRSIPYASIRNYAEKSEFFAIL